MNILDEIVLQKKIEVSQAKEQISIEELTQRPLFSRATNSMSQNIRAQGSTGIIAEFKRHSPSKKWINQHANPVEVVQGYARAGVAASSVLTDMDFFKGSLDDLLTVRAAVDIPLLRKEFIIDEYQIYEAKAHGADAILLIAAILTPQEVLTFSNLAHELGLEVLLELHQEDELAHVHAEIDMVGINNRDLKTFQVDIEQSARMASKLDAKMIKVAESGIDSPQTINYFREAGFEAFLIGERFMKSDNPAQACHDFIQQI